MSTEDKTINKTNTNTGLDFAALKLMKQLPEDALELVKDIAKDNELRLWHIVAGIVLHVHSEGRLSAFQLDPAWEDGFREEELICKYCEKPFKPRAINQPYCSNECGLRDAGLWQEPKPSKEPERNVTESSDDIDINSAIATINASVTDSGWIDLSTEEKT